MCDNQQNKPLHIAMYPWFGLCDIISYLHLANKLAKKGHKVSLFLPPNTETKLASHNCHPTLISFIPIPLPPVKGLPLGAETTNNIPLSSIPHLFTAMDQTRDTVRAHLITLRPDFVFVDFAHWLPGLAKELGIKSMFYNISYMVIIASLFLKLRERSTTEADKLGPDQGVSNPDVGLETHKDRVLAPMTNIYFGGLTLFERLRRCLEECDVIGSKTCMEMEGSYCQFVEEYFGKPVILAGPVVPEPLDSTLDSHFDSWLKGFANESVIYCAFGSECGMEKDQFQEILLGLELTGRPFLAALKPPKGYETVEAALPEGFAERTKGKGIVHDGWVQQQLILKHPSIGCFISHCGSGSISEGLVSSCQLVMIPQAMDQFNNAILMSSELKVGVVVEKRVEDGFVTKEAIRDAVSIVMEEESVVGIEVRTNHAKWRDFLLDDGLEESYIGSFIQKLRDMLA